MRTIIFSAVLLITISCERGTEKDSSRDADHANDGMVYIPAGSFTMGTDSENSYPHERPAHRVSVDGFWLDAHEVTNAEFKKFADATGYVTVAEKSPDWETMKKQLPPGTPKPPDSLLVAGSIVFMQPKEAVLSNDLSQWWRFKPGAHWRAPEGKGSSLDGKWDHPVVHVAYEDAKAYCDWAKKRLPTEAEWEFASRGGAEQEYFSWGNEFKPDGKFMANTYQGSFPVRNLGEDGFEASSPVKSFPANEYGLHDMIGNVWEWTEDKFHIEYYHQLASTAAVAKNPKGPDQSYDPYEPGIEKRVTKGGSYLCASNFCTNYRSSARQGSAVDTGTSNIGFRCARD